MIHYVVPRDQEFGLGNYIARWAPGLGELIVFLHYEDLPARSSLAAGTYIFSALDQLTPAGITLVTELQAALDAAPGTRVLNRPGMSLLRLALLEELHRAGLNWHRAVRATGSLEGLRFPVFLREEFRHSGSLTPLLSTHAELLGALGRAVLEGRRLDELLVVEFCDTSDGSGRYRNYAAIVVGTEVLPRSLGMGTQWMLKHELVEFTEAGLLEEREYVLSNPHERALKEIFARAGVEYGRIDYGIKDGAVETWEINLNPTVGPGPGQRMVVPAELQAVRQPARDEFHRRFRAALEAVQLATSGPPVPVHPGGASGAALLRPAAREGRLVGLARALGPVGKLLDPAVGLVAPWVGRAARRRFRRA